MTYDNKEKLTWERFKEMVLNFGAEEVEKTTETFRLEKNFRIEKPSHQKQRQGGVITAHMDKRVRPVINKGVVISPEQIVPFGYSTPEYCRANNPDPDCDCKTYFR